MECFYTERVAERVARADGHLDVPLVKELLLLAQDVAREVLGQLRGEEIKPSKTGFLR